MMKPKFREDKATQAAALFLSLRGGTMHHLKLMKLLYLAEREAILKWGRPIIYDSCVSMPQGTVLSQTLNLIHGEVEPSEIWDSVITSPSNHKVSLIIDPGTKSLSDAEVALIKEIFAKYGNKSRWDLRDLTHNLPEWADPEGSSIPISYEEILRAGGKTEKEVASIISEIENAALLDAYMGK